MGAVSVDQISVVVDAGDTTENAVGQAPNLRPRRDIESRPSLPKLPNTYTVWVEPWRRENRIQTCTLCSRIAFLTARFAAEAFFFFATATALYATATLRVG